MTQPIDLKTARCCCHCPRSLHSYVGCMVKGCGCQFGVPCSTEELKLFRYPDTHIVDLPDHIIDQWKDDHPGADRSDLEVEVRGNLSAIQFQQQSTARADDPALDMT